MTLGRKKKLNNNIQFPEVGNGGMMPWFIGALVIYSIVMVYRCTGVLVYWYTGVIV